MSNQAEELQPGQIITIDGKNFTVHAMPTGVGVELVQTSSNQPSAVQDSGSNESATATNEEVN